MTRKDIINSSDSVVNKVVHIAGTNYDRRRKVTKSLRRRMIQMYNAGKSISYIADYFSVSWDTVKRACVESYNESEKLRKRDLYRRMRYTTEYNPTKKRELANYKRLLLKENKKFSPVVSS